jgi:2-polyprenyl-3-methyl-5-hydroxy-6-metoxy-1,4-benzoquinol methylase
MHPVPSDLIPFYRGGYEPLPQTLSALRELAALERYRLTPVLKYKKNGKLLEIGPWMGIFSCNAKDAGFDVTAIEMDHNCVDFLRRTVGIRALQSSDPAASLDQLHAKAESFDIIALWHCLEHLPNPWLVIERAACCLAPGGILLVAIPNIESYQYQRLQAAWMHLDAPRHLFFYPVESLAKLCQKHGLTTLETTTADELSDVLGKDAWHNYARSIVPVRYVRGVLARLLRYAARLSERKPNAGAGITAIFQLPS